MPSGRAARTSKNLKPSHILDDEDHGIDYDPNEHNKQATEPREHGDDFDPNAYSKQLDYLEKHGGKNKASHTSPATPAHGSPSSKKANRGPKADVVKKARGSLG